MTAGQQLARTEIKDVHRIRSSVTDQISSFGFSLARGPKGKPSTHSLAYTWQAEHSLNSATLTGHPEMSAALGMVLAP